MMLFLLACTDSFDAVYFRRRPRRWWRTLVSLMFPTLRVPLFHPGVNSHSGSHQRRCREDLRTSPIEPEAVKKQECRDVVNRR